MELKSVIINNIEKLYLDELSNDINEIYNIVKDYRRRLYKKEHVKPRKSTKALEYDVLFSKKDNILQTKVFKTLSEIAAYYGIDKSKISYIMYNKKSYSNDIYDIKLINQNKVI